MDYIKPKPWNGEALSGSWIVTRKIDGIRAFLNPELLGRGIAVSRACKVLYGLDAVLTQITESMDVEVFAGSFKNTVSLLKSKSPIRQITMDEIYPLDVKDTGQYDHPLKKILISTEHNPSAKRIEELLAHALSLGDEGIVLRQGDKWIKVKKTETHDVLVTGIYEGKGKHTGRLGGFETPMGRVGTGFTDAEREEYFKIEMIGEMIEVKCMEILPSGKARHPVFIRHRFDKSTPV